MNRYDVKAVKSVSRSVYLLVLAMACVFIARESVMACRCKSVVTPLQELGRSSDVFSGEVMQVQARGASNAVLFQVRDSWKGVSSKSVQVFTAIPGSTCGVDFIQGQSYLVYASQGKEGLTTHRCTRTKILKDASEDLKVLKKQTAEVSQGKALEALYGYYRSERTTSSAESVEVDVFSAFEGQAAYVDFAITRAGASAVSGAVEAATVDPASPYQLNFGGKSNQGKLLLNSDGKYIFHFKGKNYPVTRVEIKGKSNRHPWSLDSKESAEVQRTWVQFRQAVIKKDMKTIRSMTQFPFKTKGNLDVDPLILHQPEEFSRLFPKLLAADTGLSATPETVEDYIRRHPQIPPEAKPGAGRFRIANLVFDQVNGRYMLTFGYMESE